MLSDSTRTQAIDKWLNGDESNSSFANYVFVRLIAKKRKFTEVDFKYAVFDSCYMRDCTFDSCDFTGCRFVASNFHGSTFCGCKFDYASFDKTDIDSSILDDCCPAFENLKARFARTLRMNYQQLGDAAGVNKAIAVELKAAETHLHKAWKSNESYYRKKYAGTTRLKMFGKWVAFKSLDFVWGNGESPMKLLRTAAFVLVLMAMFDAFVLRSTMHVGLWAALVQAPQILLGTLAPAGLPGWYLASAVALRLVVFGFFTSILIKRFSRR